jgi:hypothetical protein
MTATSIQIRPQSAYRSPADRLAVAVGATLVAWANRRATRDAVGHDRRVSIIEQELARVERDRVAFRIHELH